MSNVTLSVLVPVCGPCRRREVGERGREGEGERKDREHRSVHCTCT